MSKTIGERLENLRKELGLSMAEMGRRTGMGRDVIANIAYGRTEPKENYIRHVAFVFGVSTEYLLTGDGTIGFEGLSLAETQSFFQQYRELPEPLRIMAEDYLQGLEKILKIFTATEITVDKNVKKFQKDNDIESSQFLYYFKHLMESRSLSLDRLTKIPSLKKEEVYAILGGKQPTRNFIIRIGLSLYFSLEETQTLLSLSGNQQLHISDDWDLVVIMNMLDAVEKASNPAVLQNFGKSNLIMLD